MGVGGSGFGVWGLGPLGVGGCRRFRANIPLTRTVDEALTPTLYTRFVSEHFLAGLARSRPSIQNTAAAGTPFPGYPRRDVTNLLTSSVFPGLG